MGRCIDGCMIQDHASIVLDCSGIKSHLAAFKRVLLLVALQFSTTTMQTRTCQWNCCLYIIFAIETVRGGNTVTPGGPVPQAPPPTTGRRAHNTSSSSSSQRPTPKDQKPSSSISSRSEAQRVGTPSKRPTTKSGKKSRKKRGKKGAKQSSTTASSSSTSRGNSDASRPNGASRPRGSKPSTTSKSSSSSLQTVQARTSKSKPKVKVPPKKPAKGRSPKNSNNARGRPTSKQPRKDGKRPTNKPVPSRQTSSSSASATNLPTTAPVKRFAVPNISRPTSATDNTLGRIPRKQKPKPQRMVKPPRVTKTSLLMQKKRETRSKIQQEQSSPRVPVSATVTSTPAPQRPAPHKRRGSRKLSVSSESQSSLVSGPSTSATQGSQSAQGAPKGPIRTPRPRDARDKSPITSTNSDKHERSRSRPKRSTRPPAPSPQSSTSVATSSNQSAGLVPTTNTIDDSLQLHLNLDDTSLSNVDMSPPVTANNSPLNPFMTQVQLNDLVFNTTGANSTPSVQDPAQSQTTTSGPTSSSTGNSPFVPNSVGGEYFRQDPDEEVISDYLERHSDDIDSVQGTDSPTGDLVDRSSDDADAEDKSRPHTPTFLPQSTHHPLSTQESPTLQAVNTAPVSSQNDADLNDAQSDCFSQDQQDEDDPQHQRQSSDGHQSADDNLSADDASQHDFNDEMSLASDPVDEQAAASNPATAQQTPAQRRRSRDDTSMEQKYDTPPQSDVEDVSFERLDFIVTELL